MSVFVSHLSLSLSFLSFIHFVVNLICFLPYNQHSIGNFLGIGIEGSVSGSTAVASVGMSIMTGKCEINQREEQKMLE